MMINNNLVHFQPHYHLMVDLDILFLLVIRHTLEPTDLETNQLQEDLELFAKLIDRDFLFLEQTPDIVSDFGRYIENYCSLPNGQAHFIDRLKEIVRISSQVDYDSAIEDASKLMSHLFYLEYVSFNDIFRLVLASILGAEIYLTFDVFQKNNIEKFIQKANQEIDLHGLNIDKFDISVYDLRSFIEFIKPNISRDNIENTIQVFTPLKDTIELPIGSTPVDFAFSIHTFLGSSCCAARVNGKEVPLNTKLQNDDVVWILKSSDVNHKPDLDWCKFVVTKKAQNYIKKWHKRFNINRGKNIIKSELGNKCSLSGDRLKYIAWSLKCQTPQNLQYRLGVGEINIDDVKKLAEDYAKIKLKSFPDNILELEFQEPPVSGLIDEHKLCLIADCCRPMPDESIVGILTSKSLKIHRHDCTKLNRVSPENKRNLEWNCELCTVLLKIKMNDRYDIFRCILNKLAESYFPVDVRSLNLSSGSSSSCVKVYDASCSILVNSRSQLDHIFQEIKNIHGVIQVYIKKITPGVVKK